MKPPVPYFGGKITTGPAITALFPTHRHYVEPYAGSLAVLLAKPRSHHETVNDLDSQLMTWWRVLRDQPQELARVCALTPHSRAELDAARDETADIGDLEVARRIFVQLTQGRAGARRRTGWRHFVKPTEVTSMPDYLDTYIGRIYDAAERIAGVTLESLPALDLITKYGQEPDVLLYVDPPYLGTTRCRSWDGYRHEMRAEADHRDLADALHACKAAVVLSGYASDLYDRELYAGWDRHTIAASTGQGGTWANRTEVLWSNRPLGIQPSLLDTLDIAGAPA
ncbi:DNA adenine methylase [Micromonospora sp. HUAS LYJ1]|uniref:DNA adenine methylase n=1 Tax=Micromonospora sp. HUAS LYJ1 TaxID=3061626 RepID=UPI0026717437|nr:DNA adenine methylase [Micromonospora sp. HUAS LYJ1]WKU07991.1 DNA adenine methylase [Micromonospora sp. HUAS LYJ1]